MLDMTDFDELSAMLGLEKPDLDDYPALAAITYSVTAAIESFTGRDLQRLRRTERVQCDGRIVSLRALPVEEVHGITDAAGRSLSWAEIREFDLRLVAEHRGIVEVDYTGGYRAPPPALQRAATLQVLHEFQRKDHIGAESVSNEGGFTRWPQLGLLDEVKRMLAPFVHPARMI